MKKCAGFIVGLLLAGTLGAQAASVQMQSPDGRYLATAITTDSGSAIVMRDLVYEKKGGNGALVIPVNKSPIVAITFSADGQTMSTQEANGVKRVWRIDRGGAATLISTSSSTPPAP